MDKDDDMNDGIDETLTDLEVEEAQFDLTDFLEPVFRLHRDMAKAFRLGELGLITDVEARFLVDTYYSTQKMRVGMSNQISAMARLAKEHGTSPEPHTMLSWVHAQSLTLEKQIQRILGMYINMHPMLWFFEQTVGIGPTLAAGLVAHIDIKKAPTVGHIWRYAGLDPTVTWEKGQKRPWNAELKTICWKIGASFVRSTGVSANSHYGNLYRERKAYEIARNESGALADQAAAKLQRFNIGKDTEAYKAYSQGKLPPQHIDQRARRYATKIFLSHLHQFWWEQETGTPAPNPYPIAHLAHAHFMAPPQVKPQGPSVP